MTPPPETMKTQQKIVESRREPEFHVEIPETRVEISEFRVKILEIATLTVRCLRLSPSHARDRPSNGDLATSSGQRRRTLWPMELSTRLGSSSGHRTRLKHIAIVISYLCREIAIPSSDSSYVMISNERSRVRSPSPAHSIIAIRIITVAAKVAVVASNSTLSRHNQS
ncbi:hypothetical protein TIFTF001_031743 [Ficus carica]|uniref:Uncharacterized protein n=1 Tax=Ficus carica TaxID=3494 RepID=A0AA88J1G9_FICCA|nr:hypothetical protein TIFTF001_031743 [Ficus carica]